MRGRRVEPRLDLAKMTRLTSDMPHTLDLHLHLPSLHTHKVGQALSRRLVGREADVLTRAFV